MSWSADAALNAPASADSPSPVDYTSQIKPILTQHCVTCHGAAKPRGGLRLDTAAAALAGGKSGPAVLPGKGAESPLIEALRGEGATDRMPLNRPPLAEAEIKLIESLDRPGGQGEARRKAGRASGQDALGVRPAGQAGRSQGRSPRAGHRTRSTALSRRARSRLACRPRRKPIGDTLIRRLSLDLTGLPPSPEEVDAFLADRLARCSLTAPLDRLLASPHFGERWARLWLDQARYADSNGYNIDAPRSIWKYRDWVIAAINSGMPFDRFATEQLAGDLLPAMNSAHESPPAFIAIR